ncbi:hypothetical protein R6Q57_013636 [Mikania cordata]
MTETERKQYKTEIYRLRYEKESLFLEFQTYQREQEDIELEAHALTERLKIAGKQQKDILHVLDDILQKPAQILDTNDRKRRFLSEINDQMSLFDVPVADTPSIDAIVALDFELVEQLETSVMFWVDILTEFWEKQSTEFDHESPVNFQTGSKECEIVTNSEPYKPVNTNEELGIERASGNDGFWEQFMTENPGGSMTENSGGSIADNDSRGFDQYRKFWWNMSSLNSVAEST